MKKLLIFIGALTVVLAALAFFLPVEITEDGKVRVFGRPIGKKGRKQDRVICTDTPYGILRDKILAKKDSILDRNMGCSDCEGCERCTECSQCDDCTDCIGCEDCIDCTDCVDCLSCDDCTDCVDCVDCSDCKSCTGCIGLDGAVGKTNETAFRFYEENEE